MDSIEDNEDNEYLTTKITVELLQLTPKILRIWVG